MASTSAEPDATPLFRPEAIQAQRPSQHGEIMLVPGASSRWVAVAGLCVILALALLMGLGSYTRRSTVGGQLVPSEGLIRVTAAQPGVVTELHVRDGQTVRRGDVLAVVSGDRAGPDTGGFQRSMAVQIEGRRKLLEEELRRVTAAEPVELEQLGQRIESLLAESEQVSRQSKHLALRIKGAEEAARRSENMSAQGLLSRDELISKQADLAELRIRQQGNRREGLVLLRDAGTAQRELDTLRARYASQRSELERAILTARQEYTELESRRRIVVTAPADGQVTLVQSEVGQSVDPSRVLAHIVPASSQLVARLYAPSRAAGFVRKDAPVLMRFDAFPYQTFGQAAGKVTTVSTAAVGAADIQGFVARPEWAGEALFAITVGLPAQNVLAHGQAMPLQAGMRVEADLLHETRRLYEWILEPLYAARARMANG